jgi:hypothetical protein
MTADVLRGCRTAIASDRLQSPQQGVANDGIKYRQNVKPNKHCGSLTAGRKFDSVYSRMQQSRISKQWSHKSDVIFLLRLHSKTLTLKYKEFLHRANMLSTILLLIGPSAFTV